MRLLAVLALAVLLAGCCTTGTPKVVDNRLVLSGEECPPGRNFTGTCSDGCNTWTCDGGMCMVTSLYCPSEWPPEEKP